MNSKINMAVMTLEFGSLLRRLLLVGLIFLAPVNGFAQDVYVPYRQGTKWGIARSDGSRVVIPKYDTIRSVYQKGDQVVFFFRTDSLWGFRSIQHEIIPAVMTNPHYQVGPGYRLISDRLNAFSPGVQGEYVYYNEEGIKLFEGKSVHQMNQSRYFPYLWSLKFTDGLQQLVQLNAHTFQKDHVIMGQYDRSNFDGYSRYSFVFGDTTIHGRLMKNRDGLYYLSELDTVIRRKLDVDPRVGSLDSYINRRQGSSMNSGMGQPLDDANPGSRGSGEPFGNGARRSGFQPDVDAADGSFLDIRSVERSNFVILSLKGQTYAYSYSWLKGPYMSSLRKEMSSGAWSKGSVSLCSFTLMSDDTTKRGGQMMPVHDTLVMNNFLLWQKRKRYGAITPTAKISPMYDGLDGVLFPMESEYRAVFLVQQKGKIGLLASDGTILISPQFDSIKPHSTAEFTVKLNEQYGVLSTRLSEKLVVDTLIPIQFDEIERKRPGWYVVRKGAKYGYYGAHHSAQKVDAVFDYPPLEIHHIQGVPFFALYDGEGNFKGYGSTTGVQFFED
ncbi:MAG: hypothetical protein H6608_03360 [Flavobacteriales bacterium]|nr:hypothetical protein [Bacteroidota bacterium]MCB9240143.1 hypothetical protein [Flavobacteriales bacterium]